MEYTDLAQQAFTSMADAGTAWVNEVIPKEEDGVLKITNGKMTTVSILLQYYFMVFKMSTNSRANCYYTEIARWL